ncbi:hypothetical protein, partial [Leptospira borgpetersenii]|uniref:hypothetical protein n=1 Tax=Leptospira borgpetersenii TaxID=174 RepID=UPI001D144653
MKKEARRVVIRELRDPQAVRNPWAIHAQHNIAGAHRKLFQAFLRRPIDDIVPTDATDRYVSS